jgi:hypothetical protein
MSETGRTEAFSDGVLAIAVTLLVLDLHVPPRNTLHEPLAVALAHEWPAYAAYVTSFLIIGIIWVNHHAVFELVGRVDRSVLFLNLLLLMSVVAIPSLRRCCRSTCSPVMAMRAARRWCIPQSCSRCRSDSPCSTAMSRCTRCCSPTAWTPVRCADPSCGSVPSALGYMS